MSVPQTKHDVEFANVEAKLKRWNIRLRRAVTMIAKFEKQRNRIDRLRTKAVLLSELHTTETGKANAESWNAIPAVRKAKPAVKADDVKDDIPDFLLRKRAEERDAKIKAEVQTEQAAEAKRKADLAKERRKIKEEVREAELTGKRRKMPLQGKEALSAINS